MIDDYGEIKNKEGGKLLHVYVPTRERVWWRVEMGVEWLRWGWGYGNKVPTS